MNLAQWIVTGALRIYQCVVSPVLHTIGGPFGGCRFHPTCSVYAREAIARHGLGRGGWLTVRRICKCQPWGPCGEDLVPEAEGSSGLPSPQFTPGSPDRQRLIQHRRTWLSGAPPLSPRS